VKIKKARRRRIAFNGAPVKVTYWPQACKNFWRLNLLSFQVLLVVVVAFVMLYRLIAKLLHIALAFRTIPVFVWQAVLVPSWSLVSYNKIIVSPVSFHFAPPTQ
jgi:hypothetical protein